MSVSNIRTTSKVETLSDTLEYFMTNMKKYRDELDTTRSEKNRVQDSVNNYRSRLLDAKEQLFELEKENFRNLSDYKAKKDKLEREIQILKTKLTDAVNQITYLRAKLESETKANSIIATELDIPIVIDCNNPRSEGIVMSSRDDEPTDVASLVEYVWFDFCLSRATKTSDRFICRLADAAGEIKNINGQIENLDDAHVKVIFEIPRNTLKPGKYNAIVFYSNAYINKQIKIGSTYFTDELK